MHALNNYLLVFVGGGLGACLRHACNLIGTRVAVGSPWPWSTFLINISGALLMGALVEAFALRNGASPQLRLLLATGVLGGYTRSPPTRLKSVCCCSAASMAWQRCTPAVRWHWAWLACSVA